MIASQGSAAACPYRSLMAVVLTFAHPGSPPSGSRLFVTERAALEDRGRVFFARGSKLSYSRGRRRVVGRVPCLQRQSQRVAKEAASPRAATPCGVYPSGVLRLPSGVLVERCLVSVLVSFFFVLRWGQGQGTMAPFAFPRIGRRPGMSDDQGARGQRDHPFPFLFEKVCARAFLSYSPFPPASMKPKRQP